MARPTKAQQAANTIRDKDILDMHQKNYPLEYIAAYYNLSKTRVVRIIKTQEAIWKSSRPSTKQEQPA